MRACGKTDVGLRRHENQDTFAVEQGEKLLIAVVCDGMGGAEGGQIASSVAVETFMKEMRALIRADMTAEQLRELASFCVAKANTAVYQRALQDPAYQGMGTTLVSAVAEEKYAIVCNIGDSRAYLIRGGEITRITHDHSVVQTLVENGRRGGAHAPEPQPHHPRARPRRKHALRRVRGLVHQGGQNSPLHGRPCRHRDGRRNLPRRVRG